MNDSVGGSARRFGGRFALQSELGSGGMAAVYLGRDEVLGRTVAVKVLKHGFDGGEIAERFQREGRTAAKLSHPNIVQVYDAGEAELDGRAAPYIVMEYVSGGDLKRLIDAEGRLPSGRVARLGAGVCAGLTHAHDRGVVHRDIKPHNILLDETGAPKLTDFGIARALDTTAMTGSGAYLGTALYSAPEQLKGEEVTPKSDIYSLGAALYQAATGEPPFSGAPIEVASQHIGREPDPPGAARDSGEPDPELDALILACLAKDPARRPDAYGLRDRLSTASAPGVRGPGGPGYASGRRASGRRKRPVLRTFAGAVALALLLSGVAFAMLGDGLNPGGDDSGTGTGGQRSGGEEVGRADPAASGGAGQAAPTTSAPAAEPTTTEPTVPEPTTTPQTGEDARGGAGIVGAGASEGTVEAEAGEAARTVESVYQLAAAGDYAGSYGLLSEGFRQSEAGSQENWAATFETLEGISFTEGPAATVSGDTAQVTGATQANHTYGTERNQGTWTLVREGGEWRLDGLSLQSL